MTRWFAMSMVALLAAAAAPAHAVEGERDLAEPAAQREVRGEITPYLWIVGMDADVTVGGTTVSPSVGFSDLMDAADFGGSVFAQLEYQRLLAYLQLDYLKLSTSNLDHPPAAGKLDSESLFTAFGVGYQFPGLWGGSSVGAMIGLRVAYFDNELTLYGSGSASGSKTLVDPLLILTPSIPITRWLRLNPTFSIGAFGDSDWTYELQPHLQFQLTDHVAARVGYRRLYMDYQGNKGEISGAMHGFLVGLGLTL